MGLFKKLDFWSIMDGLDRLIDYDLSGNQRESIYWDFYSDQIRELSILAADMYNELDAIKTKLYYKMPYKKIAFCEEDDCTQTAIAWFNTAACMLSDVDMSALLESENIYRADELAEKANRIRALEKLTKEQQMFLYAEVIGFLTRYLELVAAFDVIRSVITELDYHHASLTGKDGNTILPVAAYL